MCVQHSRRVGEGDHYLVVAGTDGQRRILSCELLGEKQRDLWLHLGRDEIDERHLVLLGDEAGDVGWRHRPASDEDLAEPLASREALLGEGGLELVFGDDVVPDEECPERGPRVHEVEARGGCGCGRRDVLRLRGWRLLRRVLDRWRHHFLRGAELPRPLERVRDGRVHSLGR